MPRYDTAVLNGTVVVPYVGTLRCDVGVGWAWRALSQAFDLGLL